VYIAHDFTSLYKNWLGRSGPNWNEDGPMLFSLGNPVRLLCKIRSARGLGIFADLKPLMLILVNLIDYLTGSSNFANCTSHLVLCVLFSALFERVSRNILIGLI